MKFFLPEWATCCWGSVETGNSCIWKRRNKKKVSVCPTWHSNEVPGRWGAILAAVNLQQSRLEAMLQVSLSFKPLFLWMFVRPCSSNRVKPSYTHTHTLSLYSDVMLILHFRKSWISTALGNIVIIRNTVSQRSLSPPTWSDPLLPGAHNKLIPGQIKGELGEVPHTRVRKAGDPRTERWKTKHKRKEL